jgi:alpha/beta superfamily hydrolase
MTLFFNFRGAGESGGNIDFYGWTRDLAAVLDFLWENHYTFDRQQVYLAGISAGAATAVFVAARDSRIAGVAACACPADYSFFNRRAGREEIIAMYRGMGAIRDEGFPASVDEWFEGLEEVTPERHVSRYHQSLALLHGAKDQTCR